MLGMKNKVDTLFWIAISGLILTSIYTVVLGYQGVKTKKMIRFIYAQNKKWKNQNENQMSNS